MKKIKLELCSVSKVYSDVVANKNISLKLFEGEIHGIVGQNGAGKTTLMKLLFGMEQPDGGRICLNGREEKIASTKAAIALGIGMVQQNFALAESLTAGENITLGMSVGDINAFTHDLCTRFGLSVNPLAMPAQMSAREKQKVELLRALARGAELLILDEPTAALTAQERDSLFVQLSALRDSGKTIIFITHKLPELGQICDRVTVLRDGSSMGTFPASIPSEELARIIVGADSGTILPKKSYGGEIAMALENLAAGALKRVNIKLPKGAVLGVAGGAGSGRDELIAVLSGQIPLENGSISIFGELQPKNKRIDGLGYIDGDIQAKGLAIDGTIVENFIAGTQRGKLCRAGFLQMAAAEKFTKAGIEDIGIVYKSLKQRVSELSGGNMQKLAIARECAPTTKILVAEEPTKGLDTAASAMVLDLISQVAQRGCAVVASSDVAMLQGFCSHILILHAGEVAAFFEGENIAEQELGLYIMGVKKRPWRGGEQNG